MISTKTINDIPKQNINLLTFWNRKRRHGQTGNRGRRQSEKWRRHCRNHRDLQRPSRGNRCGWWRHCETCPFSRPKCGDWEPPEPRRCSGIGSHTWTRQGKGTSGCIMILTAALHFHEAWNQRRLGLRGGVRLWRGHRWYLTQRKQQQQHEIKVLKLKQLVCSYREEQFWALIILFIMPKCWI